MNRPASSTSLKLVILYQTQVLICSVFFLSYTYMYIWSFVQLAYLFNHVCCDLERFEPCFNAWVSKHMWTLLITIYLLSLTFAFFYCFFFSKLHHQFILSLAQSCFNETRDHVPFKGRYHEDLENREGCYIIYMIWFTYLNCWMSFLTKDRFKLVQAMILIQSLGAERDHKKRPRNT